jgi:hypothetical protein
VVNSDAPEGLALHVPLVASAVKNQWYSWTETSPQLLVSRSFILSVLLFTVSDYLFSIFKHFFKIFYIFSIEVHVTIESSKYLGIHVWLPNTFLLWQKIHWLHVHKIPEWCKSICVKLPQIIYLLMKF